MKVPRDLLICSPFTVRKPCANSLVGVRKPACCSIAGQNSAWKYRMSLPMKWYSSVLESGFQYSSNNPNPPRPSLVREGVAGSSPDLLPPDKGGMGGLGGLGGVSFLHSCLKLPM